MHLNQVLYSWHNYVSTTPRFAVWMKSWPSDSLVFLRFTNNLLLNAWGFWARRCKAIRTNTFVYIDHERLKSRTPKSKCAGNIQSLVWHPDAARYTIFATFSYIMLFYGKPSTVSFTLPIAISRSLCREFSFVFVVLQPPLVQCGVGWVRDAGWGQLKGHFLWYWSVPYQKKVLP